MAGEQTAQPIQQEQQVQTETGTHSEPDYKKLYEETQGKVKEFESKYSEASDAISNFEQYFNKDQVAAERAKLYL